VLKLKASGLQHPAQNIEVNDAQATQVKQALDTAPGYNAFATMNNIRSHPQKALHVPVHGPDGPRWQLDTERRVDWHR
jgi:hypothetical protein